MNEREKKFYKYTFLIFTISIVIITAIKITGLLDSKALSCPDNYVLIPSDGYFNDEPFCVMKYEARALSNITNEIVYDGCGNLSDLASCNLEGENNWADLNVTIPFSTNEGAPWRRISFYDAAEACESLGKNNKLITNREWMSIARNIEQLESNWLNNETGYSTLSKGLHKREGFTENFDTLNHPAANSKDECKYAYATGEEVICEADGHFEFKRTHMLSTGEEIWDFAGNLWHWVDANETRTSLRGNICQENGWNYYDECALDENSHFTFTDAPDNRFEVGPLLTDKTRNGIGMVYSSDQENRVFRRGGSWFNRPGSGIFALDLRANPDSPSTARGFRCTYSLN